MQFKILTKCSTKKKRNIKTQKKNRKKIRKTTLPNDEHAESGVGGGKSSLT